MANLLDKILESTQTGFEKIARSKPIVEGSALMWQNFVRAGIIENITCMDPDACVNSMIASNVIRLFFGPAYQWGREKIMHFFEKEYPENPLLNPNDKKNIDRKYGLIIALGEAGINAAAYHFLYGEQSIGKSLISGAMSASLTAFGNLNGRMLDTSLELNDLPNEGRSFIVKYKSSEEKRKMRNLFYALMFGFPTVYVAGMKLTTFLYQQ